MDTIYKITKQDGQVVWLLIADEGKRIVLAKTVTGKYLMQCLYRDAKVIDPINEIDLWKLPEIISKKTEIQELLK